MELSNVIAFICGGLVSAILFYPKHKHNETKVDFIASLLSFQFYFGIHCGQQENMPKLKFDDIFIIIYLLYLTRELLILKNPQNTCLKLWLKFHEK